MTDAVTVLSENDVGAGLADVGDTGVPDEALEEEPNSRQRGQAQREGVRFPCLLVWGSIVVVGTEFEVRMLCEETFVVLFIVCQKASPIPLL